MTGHYDTKMKIFINLDVKESFHCWKRFFVLVRIKMFLFDLSERCDVSMSVISKTSTTWINCIMSCYYISLFLCKN